jgi:uncharacterized phosphosugar-binding protein
MGPIEKYYDVVADVIKQISITEKAAMEKAAQLVADCVADGRLFHTFGTGGHSNMAAIEVCHRAGNLVPCNAILDSGIGCEHGATRGFERLTGYARCVLDYYRVKEGEVIVLVNAYGMNCVTIDTALECKARGLKTIGITSPELSVQVPPEHPARHPSKKNLFELVDVVINSYTPFGEAVVDIEGLDFKVSPISTITNLFIINSINAATCQYLHDRGIKPPVWTSGNIPGGDEANQAYMDAYFGKIRHL